MNGMDETHFAPEGNLTRGQLVTTLYRLAGEPEVAEPATFSDVKAGRYYTEAVAWGEDLGIVKGMTDDTFSPEGTVTREQAATFLYRYVTNYLKQEPGQGADLKAFADGGKVQDYAKTAMSWAAFNSSHVYIPPILLHQHLFDTFEICVVYRRCFS